MKLKLLVLLVLSTNLLLAQKGQIHAKFDLPEHLRSITQIIKYPTDSYKEGIEGKVYVSFNLMSSGNIEDVIILNPMSESLDQEVIRTLSALNGFWHQPTRLDTVVINLIIPIEFKIISKKSKVAETYYLEGIEYLNRGKAQKAEISILEALRRAPRNAQYLKTFEEIHSSNNTTLIESLNSLKNLQNIDSLTVLVKAYKGNADKVTKPINNYRDLVNSLELSSVEHFDDDWNRVESGGIYTRISQQHPIYGYNGVAVDYFHSDEVFSRTLYELGKLNGKFKLLYQNGKTKMSGSFLNNQPNGQWKFYSESGDLTLGIKFGKERLKIKEFRMNEGELIDESVFDYSFLNPLDGKEYNFLMTLKDSKIHGKVQTFINGQLYFIENYQEGEYIDGYNSEGEKLDMKVFDSWVFIPYHLLKLEK